VIRFAARCFESNVSSGCAQEARLRTSHCHRWRVRRSRKR